MSFWMLFTNITLSLWAVQSFNTFCFIARYFFFSFFIFILRFLLISLFRVKWKFFERFVDGSISKWIQICFVVPCFFIPFALFLFCVIYFFTHNSSSDKLILTVASFTFAAFPFRNSPLNSVFRVYGAICTCIVALFVVLSIILVLGINYRIAFLQWRAMFIQFYFLIGCGIYIWYYLGSDPDRVIQNYIKCVGSHPRIDPPPCQRNPSEGRILIFFTYLVTFLFPVLVSFVVTFTNPLVSDWWKELIFKRKIVRSMSSLDTLMSDRSPRSLRE